MDMSNLFTKALGIEHPWEVTGIEFDEAGKRLDIQLKFKKGTRFKYTDEKRTGEYPVYDTVEKEWRHLNFFEHECYLKARVPRVKTPDGKVRLIMPDWNGLQAGFTLLFEALILQFAQHMPVHQIAKLMKMTDYKVWSMLERYVASARELENYAKIEQVGMDETSIAKGHEYLTLFVDLEERRTIFVAKGKGHKTVEDFKAGFEAHGGKTGNVREVSCDMSPAFIKGVKENLPEAKITFDKFHIIKLLNTAVDQVRRAEARINPLLKGTRYLFLKNDQNLTENQKEKKERLKLSKVNDRMFRALKLRETFQQLYQLTTEEEFEPHLKAWYFWATHSRIDPIKQVAKAIKKHWDGVIRWKVSQINNGILEGLNSVIQAAKRKARGYKFEHFKTIAYLMTGKLNFNQLNLACPPT